MVEISDFDWLEFHPRPKRDGLHDSGYRYIRLVGVKSVKGSEPTKTELHKWSDHVVLNGPVNIDVEPDGTIRIMPCLHAGWQREEGNSSFFASSAMFDPVERKSHD